MRPALLAAWIALSMAGCTEIVAVDDYTFDVDPCGPRPPTCSPGGRSYSFVVQTVDVARADAAGAREGFDFDGTADPICDQADFVDPDGTRGIDNSMAPIFEFYENLSGTNLRSSAAMQAVMGQTQIVVIEGVDDRMNDDCVTVSRRDVVIPDGMTAADLDHDGDGLLDPNLTLDYRPPSDRDSTACIREGVLHARFPTVYGILPGTMSEGTVDRGRLRMPFDETGSHDGLVGGSIHVDDLVGSLPDAVVEFIRLQADLDPSSRDARDCGSISFALICEMIPVSLGTLRSSTPGP